MAATTLLYRWTKTNSVTLVNAISLAGTTAVTSIFGFAYWWIAAWWFPPQAIGLGSAAISAMNLLGMICTLGLGTLLVYELPRQLGKEGSLITAVLIIVGAVGVCVGLVFAVAASYIATDLQALRANIEDIVVFASGVSLTAITFVFDQALIALLHGELQFLRNTLFAAAKLAALFAASFWLSHTLGMTIYAIWVVGNVFSLAALVGYAVLKRGKVRSTYKPMWGLVRWLDSRALQHYMLNLTLQTPTLALPILVMVFFSATANAWFYISWMVAGFMFVVPTALTTLPYATISGQSAAQSYKMWLPLSLALVAGLLTTGILLLDTRQILGLFGQAYAEHAASSLRILSFGSFPLIIKYHYGAICRIHDRIARATMVIIAGIFLELGMAALGARLGGLPGLSFGWVTASCIEAIFLSRAIYIISCKRNV